MKAYKVSIDELICKRKFYMIEAASEVELFSILDDLQDHPPVAPYAEETLPGRGSVDGYIEYGNFEEGELPEEEPEEEFVEDTGNSPTFLRKIEGEEHLHLHRCPVTLVAFIGDTSTGDLLLPFENATAVQGHGMMKTQYCIRKPSLDTSM